jgi:4-amino-4-deoxy-L-arabinose transferase-like glycosyltransferase
LNRQNSLILLLLALIAVAIVILATKFGIGITPDSTVYIETGRNLLNGRGLIALAPNGELKPMTHYPPLYPSVLALLGLLGLSLETAARLLNAFLFGANVLLVGIALRCFSRKSFWLPILGALLTLTAPDIAGIHTFALSEPLFLLLALCSLVTLARFLETRDLSWLIAAASLAALAMMTRYVGVALIITGVAALLLVRNGDWRSRLGSAMIFGMIACVPLVLWAIRNATLAGGGTDRQVVFHPPGLKEIVVAFSTISSWLLAGKIRGDLRAGFFVAEVVLTALFFLYLTKEERKSSSAAGTAGKKFQRDGNLAQLPLVLVIYIGSYLGCILIATSFFDLVIFDDRTLVPVHVVSIILVTGFMSKLLSRFQSARWIRIAFALTAIALIGSYSLRGTNWFNRTRRDGQGYASRAWKDSETIAHVRKLPARVSIYSNGYHEIYYLSGRPAINLPEKINHNTGRANENYETEVEKVRRDLGQGDAVFVYFKTLPERWLMPSEAELVQELRPRSVESTVDGSIFSGGE